MSAVFFDVNNFGLCFVGILNDMKPFENFPEDLNQSRELQNEETEPTLQDIKEDALLSISFTEKQDEDAGNELENEELSSRKISNGMFGPLYNKDPAKLSKILSSDLARKDALTGEREYFQYF